MGHLEEDYLIGVDLGGSKLAIGKLGANGLFSAFEKVKTQGESGPKQVTKQIIELIERVVSSQQGQLRGIGVGVPGSVNWQTGVINKLTNLSGWEGYPLQNILEKCFKVAIVIENDANAAAWGEYSYGAGKGCQEMLYLTVSTGIGAGIIMGGHLKRGFTGNAGEVGHMVLKPGGEPCNCGNLGCWETLSSGTAIALQAKKLINQGWESSVTHLAGEKDIKAEHIFAAYERGDQVAKIVVDEALDYLGIGVANLVNIINPQRVVVGGGVTKAGSIIFSAIKDKVKKLGYAQSTLTQVVPAKLGDQVGVIGAAALVLGKYQVY